MKNMVPASTPIRRSRVQFIDPDRLNRRQQFLVELADSGFCDEPNRRPFVQRAQELLAVEEEMHARGMSFARRTLPRELWDKI